MADIPAAAVSHDQVRARLIELVQEITGSEPGGITEDATLDSLKMDSITFVELQVAIEDEWGIEIDAIEVVELNALGAIIDYVHARIPGQSP